MDRQLARPPVVESQNLLHIAPALKTARRRSVTPVTLERRWVTMEMTSPSSSPSSSCVDPVTTKTPSTATITTSTSPSPSTLTSTGQPAVQTSIHPPAGATGASAAGTARTICVPAPSTSRVGRHSPSPTVSAGSTSLGLLSIGAAPVAPARAQADTLVGGDDHIRQQRPTGAADSRATSKTSPNAATAMPASAVATPIAAVASASSLSPHAAGRGQAGDAGTPSGGARSLTAPAGRCPSPHTPRPGTTPGTSQTRKPVTREELTPQQAGHGLHDETTSTLSTGEHHGSRGGKSGDRGREACRRTGGSSRLAVQFSDESSPRSSPRAVGDVMQFFAEQEKSLQESFLALPKKSTKKQRSPSPKVSPAAGLEHLDHLIRLMEQLGSLKDENSRLRQRCRYLESTRVLLQARKDMPDATPSRKKQQQQQKQRHHIHHHHHHPHQEKRVPDSQTPSTPAGSGEESTPSGASRLQNTQISSAEELDLWELVDASSDQRHKRSRSGMQKRSKSTGSLEIPSDILLDDVGGGDTRKRLKPKAGRSIFSSKSGAKSKSSKSSSKWARLKIVLTGQKLYEDLGTTIKSLRELGRSSGARHSTSGVSGSPPSSRLSSGEARHTDSGLGSTDAPHRPPLVVVPLIHRHPEIDPASRSEQEVSDSELTGDIWMGPPDWWEEYEARTEGSGCGLTGDDHASSATGDATTPIEVTTMYLGGAKTSSLTTPSSSLLTTSMTASTLSSSSTATPSSPTSPLAATTTTSSVSEQQFLSVSRQAELSRRQSSPSLNGGRDGDEEKEDFLEELASMPEGPIRTLHKSSSCQSADLEFQLEGHKGGKGHRTAWGRVKDMMRKDSVKRRPKKQRSEPRTGIESEETSEVDVEGILLDEQLRAAAFGEGLLSRSTPKSSPLVSRQQGRTAATAVTTVTTSTTSGPANRSMDVAAILAGQMSDDFSKKMQEWEAMKTRKTSSFRGVTDDSEVGSLDVSVTSQELAVRTVDLKDFRGKVPDSSSDGTTPGESHTSLEVLGAPTASPAHLEEIQRRMTDSFSRKMQEWERLKYRSSQGSASGRGEPPSPDLDLDRKASSAGAGPGQAAPHRTRKEERGKSKRSREEKERDRLEKIREREMQKVEKEQVKLEKEKLRLEKDRLRALEREAKLEKLKGRLSSADADMGGGMKNPVLGPLAEYKVTADFAHKLHEWELRKGLSHDVSNSIYLEAQKLNMQHLTRESVRHTQPRATTSEGDANDGAAQQEEPEGAKGRVQPLTLRPYWGTPEERSPVERCPDEAVEQEDEGEAADIEEGDADDETATSLTEECLAKTNIASLEHANKQLIDNLQQKELEYADVQQQVLEVNRKLAKVKEEHAVEMARFHRELALGSIAEPVRLEVGELETTIHTMEEKIKAMENLGERLALSMESAAVGKWQSIDGEETVHSQLVELVDQMRNMLVQASHSAEESKKSMALSNFEKLYSHAMKLQVQMNNLRLSHLERNREIMTVKRQLLLQEVNNLILQADITRRETELYQYHAAKKFASLRRWNTFSGSHRSRLHSAPVESTPKPRVEVQPDGRSRPVDAPHVNIPYIPEEVILASAASSSLSAPPSPSAVEAAGGTPAQPGSSPTIPQPYLNPGTTSSEASGAPSSRSTLTKDNGTSQPLAPLQASPSRLKGVLPTSATHASPSLVRAVSDPQRGSRDLVVCPTAGVGSASSLTDLPSPSDTNVQPSLKPLQQPADNIRADPSLAGAVSVGVTSLTQGHESRAGDQDSAEERTKKEQQHLQHRQHDEQSGAASTASPGAATGATTMVSQSSDSVPLYKEIRELRKAKSLVERGSPTLIYSKTGRGSSAAPSPAKSISPNANQFAVQGTPLPTIPQQPGPGVASMSTSKSALAADNLDQDSSHPTTVITQSSTDQAGEPQPRPVTEHVTSGAAGGSLPIADSSQGTRLSPMSEVPRGLPPTNDSGRQGKCPRSPVTKHNYLRRQKEERDASAGDYRAISPKGSPVATRGKPPLPRQNTPVRHSPHASPVAPEKGPRSKSVGEMMPGRGGNEVTSRPLQETINKFEKRQTMCETEERPVELRKTPSPTLHLPRVGLVSRIRRLKPAAELLEESQRYRSGHSIYATRIMHRVLPKDELAALGASGGIATASSTPAQSNKENVLVQAIVQRLSRETSPVKSLGSSRSNSELSLKRTDSTHSNSDFVSHIVRKLSNGSASGSPKSKGSNTHSPLKDRTNEGQVKKITQSFDDSPDRALSDSSLGEHTHVQRRAGMSSTSPSKNQKRKSCEIDDMSSTHVSAAKSSPPDSGGKQPAEGAHASSTGALDSASLTRVRAATYCLSDQARREASRDVEPARPLSSSSPLELPQSHTPSTTSDSARSSRGGSKDARSPTASLSPIRRGAGRGKMGTVGVLCKQSISFDLGVTLYAQKSQAEGGSPKPKRPVRSWDPSESSSFASSHEVPELSTQSEPGPSRAGQGRPLSSGSEGETTQPGSQTEERNKLRRFLDSSWLQKSKKFFKVSK